MKAHLIVLLSGLCCVFVWPAAAQDSTVIPYAWEQTGISLSYPAGWDVPVPSTEEDGTFILSLSQILSADPQSRPPGVPFINLTLLPNTEPVAELSPFIADELTTLGLTPGVTTPATLMSLEGLAGEGVSADGLLFGLARAVALQDNRILVVSGRAPEASRAAFTDLFNNLADGLTLGDASVSPQASYGVLWNTLRTLADGETAFVNLLGLEEANGQLYSVDSALGVVVFDAASGALLANYPNPDLAFPTDLAVSSDGTVYIADTTCQCVQVLAVDGTWGAPISGFEAQSPASIAVTADGTLYATELTVSGIQVHARGSDQEAIIPFGPEVVEQPLLSLGLDGHVLALTQDGLLLAVSNEDLAPLVMLNVSTPFIEDFAVDSGGNFILATGDSGLLLVSPDGQTVEGVGRIVANFPLPGEFVHPRGVALGADGTIYAVDSDGSFGSVTAMNTGVAAGRVGSTMLIPGIAVQGTLDATITSQDWILSGVAGQAVTISAVDETGTGVLDVGLKLIAPDGTEEAGNDDQEGADLATEVDSQIAAHVLAQSGDYTVRVEIVNGSGTYRLGVVQELSFTLEADGTTQIQGEIEGALPEQRWTFEGLAGNVLTITMLAESGTLDPVLRLVDANGNVVAENDDAADTALGKNAQLVGVSLPANGVYTLEAARFDGAGAYTIHIVATA